MSDPRPSGSTIRVPENVDLRAVLEDVLSGKTPAVMHFQPIVDLQRGHVAGYEALIRFPSPPAMPPDHWFLHAQRYDRRMELEAMAAAAALASRSRLARNTFLSLNVSPVFLLSSQFQELLSTVPDLKSIVLEITEGDRIGDYAAVRKRLETVRAMGGSVAVDDTGSGYASLKHVMELRPNFVKLDRFFVSDCHDEPSKAEMIYMIGEAADRMDAWLIAEGIETESELHEVMRRMVPLGQGYLLGRPAPEMNAASEDAVRTIQLHRKNPGGAGLWHLLESAVTVRRLEEAEAVVRSADRGRNAAVLDEDDRPTHLVEAHPRLGVHTLPSLMRVGVSTQPTDVLRRAISRPLAQRFDPVVVTGECGEFLGLLRMDHLMQGVLAKLGPSAVQ